MLPRSELLGTRAGVLGGKNGAVRQSRGTFRVPGRPFRPSGGTSRASGRTLRVPKRSFGVSKRSAGRGKGTVRVGERSARLPGRSAGAAKRSGKRIGQRSVGAVRLVLRHLCVYSLLGPSTAMTKDEFLKDPTASLLRLGGPAPPDWVAAAWQDSQFRQNVTFAMTRSVCKNGDFFVADFWLKTLPTFFSADQTVELYEHIRGLLRSSRGRVEAGFCRVPFPPMLPPCHPPGPNSNCQD